jgi:type I restriction-modification system DNA methylase subunit
MPLIQEYIFNRKLLQKALERVHLLHIENIQQKKEILANWKRATESASLNKAGEIAMHGDFLLDIFCRVLGYKRQIEHPSEWNLVHEQKTKTDATRADGALGFFTPESQDIRVIIELKNAKTNLDARQYRQHDKRSPVEQAFSYVHKSGKTCRWVIVSNYKELRLYHADSSGEYEGFAISALTGDQDFKRFYFLLSAANLISKEQESVIDALYKRNESEKERISKRFYAEYKQARFRLFDHLKRHNPEYGDVILLEKTQKFLDRFIFVCFCEDTHLLPPNIFREAVQNARQSFSFTEGKIWAEVKGLFQAINEGHPGRSIHGFNGGLFAEDPLLDHLNIRNTMFESLALIAEYDFDSDLSVNILGHIFEQSISDLEEFRADIQGKTFDRRQGKRKKQGIFYTPEYITRYIVEKAVGGWLEDRQQELGVELLPELAPKDYASVRQTKSGFKYNKAIEQHMVFWEAYKKKLMDVTLLDPACGSGAFLNQAFDFLYKEGQRVNEALAGFRQGQTDILDLDRHILSNNLYGVDLNSESAEITKLSLWLKTANKRSPLTALDGNIRCGNSLIADFEAGGDKAFQWESAFPQILQHGGFDVIIGNPPYIFTRNQGFSETEKTYLYEYYHLTRHQLHSFVLFVEKGFQLLAQNGFLGYIVPNNWLTLDLNVELRKFLLRETARLQVINLGDKIFEDASVDTCILVFQKAKSNEVTLGEWEKSEQGLEKGFTLFSPIDKSEITPPKYYFQISKAKNAHLKPLLKKIERCGICLGNFALIKAGVKVYEVGAGAPKQTKKMRDERVYHAASPKDETWFKYLDGRNVSRYCLSWNGEYVKYGKNMSRRRQEWFFEVPRILVRQIPNRLPYCFHAAYSDEKYINDINSMIILQPKGEINLKYVLAVLNSRVLSFWFYYTFDKFQRKTFPQFKVSELKMFPIPQISGEAQVPFIEVAEKMICLNKQCYEDVNKFLRFIKSAYAPKNLSNPLQEFYKLTFRAFITELKKQKAVLSKKDEFELTDLFEEQKTKILVIKQRMDDTDPMIDKMVYKLYGLSEEEIQLINP